MPRITSLHIYPIKALHAIDADSVYTTEYGLAYDRTWMLVNAQGVAITQRDIPTLARFITAVEKDRVTVTFEGETIELVADNADGSLIPCTLWKTEFLAREYSGEVSSWFKERLDYEARLVQPAVETYRTAKNRADTSVNFQDAHQILVLSEASVADLNSRLDKPVPMNRFRPNIVVDGFEAYQEDRIAGLRIGDVELEAVGPCGRCMVTTVDQQTGVKGTEPLKTLASYRSEDGKVLFGQYFRVATEPDREIRHGAQVEIIS